MKFFTTKTAILPLLACGIIVFSIFFLAKNSPNEQSLKLDFQNLNKSINSGDIKQIEKKLIYIPERYVEGEKYDLLMTLSQTKHLLSINIKQQKVIGSVGVIAYTYNHNDTEAAIFAIHNGLNWQFDFSSSYWTQENDIHNTRHHEQDQADAIALLKWLNNNTKVGQSGIGPHERLTWYLPFVPPSLNIEEFYETPSPSMDHDYIWKIKIEDADTFKKFITQLTSPPPNAIGGSKLSESPVFRVHPTWWKNLDFTKGNLKQYNIELTNNIKGSAKTTIFAFIDQQENYIYIFTSS
ncbi:MAG: hypothetical protein ACSHX6_12245 [Akkermansiaceae bacterium]